MLSIYKSALLIRARDKRSVITEGIEKSGIFVSKKTGKDIETADACILKSLRNMVEKNSGNSRDLFS